MKQDILLILVALLPALFVLIFSIAAKHTRIKRMNDCPTALKASLMDTNGPERKYGVY